MLNARQSRRREETTTCRIIENMTQATHTDTDPCTSCGGHGWKFLSTRRSSTRAGDAGERASLRRPRVKCLFCQGTGHRHPVVSAEDAQGLANPSS